MMLPILIAVLILIFVIPYGDADREGHDDK